MYNKTKEVLAAEQVISEDMLEQLTLWADAEMAKQNEKTSREEKVQKIITFSFLYIYKKLKFKKLYIL